MANDYASKPMYEKIFAELRDKITSNQYEAGQRVPSEKELGEQYNVSRITSKKALELLASEGYIVRKPGRGSFVAEAPYSRIHSAGASPSGNRKPRSASDKSLIGLIITDFAESYGTDLIYGMEEMSRASDSYLVIRRTLGIPSLEEEAVKGMLELGVNGLIILNFESP